MLIVYGREVENFPDEERREMKSIYINKYNFTLGMMLLPLIINYFIKKKNVYK
jgi:hypothetical protein